ncbi:MAG: putative LPS assembly protein LptD [Candidatus Latescibacterota bacterium]|jgi:hypothetical protein
MQPRFPLAVLLLLAGRLAADPAPAAPPDSSGNAVADSGLAAAVSLLDGIRGRDRARGFEYQADTFVVFGEAGDSILLRGRPARVTHREARLEAAELFYRRAEEVVEAQAAVDSAGVVYGLPELKRGEEVLRGERIVYDLKREQGIVLQGRIRRDRGYFAGQRIVAVSEEELRVGRGSYTTCDRDHPHFDFFSPRIKVIQGEMAIARPVYLRIAERRLLWFPFYVFSLRQDRQSGLLTPSFGRRSLRYGSSETEWEIRSLGYYLAPSPYWDLTLATDLRQQSGWLARASLVHALRYRWNGRVTAQFENRQDGYTVQRAWRLEVQHNQELSPTTQLRASGTMQSNRTFGQDNGISLLDRLNRTLRSNASLSKRWPRSGNTLSVNASQTRNLDTRTSDLVFPEMSFRKARRPLWGGTTAGASGVLPSSTGTAVPLAWYRQIYYDGGLRLRNSRRTTSLDTVETTAADLDLRASSQHKPLSWLQVSPSLSETWQDADLRSGEVRGRRTDRISASATLTQTVYGLFQPRVWQVTALRHVAKPNLALAYQAIRADTGGVLGFGGESSGWRQSRRLDLRLDNTLWAKVERGEEEVKVRLAQVDFSTAYDLDADARPLSDLVTAVSVAAGRRLDSRLTLRSEFYDDRNEFMRTPRLRQVEVRSTVRSAGPGAGSDDRIGSGAARYGVSSSDAYPGDSFGYDSGLRSEPAATERSLQLSHYYSRTRSFSSTVTRSWVRLAVGFSAGRILYSGDQQPRPRWRFDYAVNYNLHAPGLPLAARDRITSELLTLRREFHDWTATLSLEPSTFSQDRAFYLRIQLRDIPQLRFERGDARL